MIRAQARDDKAFQLLFEHYQSDVFSQVFALTTNREIALDISQDVWLAAFLALPTLKNPASFPAWLKRIAIHKAWSFNHRKALQTVLIDFQADDASFALEEDDPLHKVLIDEKRRHLYQLLTSLTDKEYEVLVYYYLEEMSQAEIAQSLRLTLPAIKSRLHEARKRLRQLAQGGYLA